MTLPGYRRMCRISVRRSAVCRIWRRTGAAIPQEADPASWVPLPASVDRPSAARPVVKAAERGPAARAEATAHAAVLEEALRWPLPRRRERSRLGLAQALATCPTDAGIPLRCHCRP